MDFFKNLFGKKDQGAASSANTSTSGGATSGQGGGQTSQGGSSQGKESHDSGHPNGGAGKNVCEFC